MIAVLASGEGTTAEAFIRSSAAVPVGLVITNNKEAGILRRVAQLNRELGLKIKTAVINGVSHPATAGEIINHGQQTAAEEQALLKLLQADQYDAIVLMGYMKKMGPALVREFGWRSTYTSPDQTKMINTHPGLLPATKGFYGLHVQEQVLKLGFKKAGQTLHVVADEYDEGPVIVEHVITVSSDDTADSLFERVKTIEKKFLPGDVANFIKQRKEWYGSKS